MTSFARSFEDHEEWLRQAAQFIAATELLVAGFYPPPAAPRTEAINLRMTGCLRGAVLLLALAIENALKAVLVAKKQVKVSGGRVNPKDWCGPGSGHNLSKLAERAGLSPTAAEQSLLARLTPIAEWAGKFRHPLTEAQYQMAQLNNPHTLTVPTDIRVARDIIAESENLARTCRLRGSGRTR